MSFQQRRNIFIDLLFPKTKPISIDIICEPPNLPRFSEEITTEFEALDLNDENCILGDFIINLLIKRKYIVDRPNEIRKFYK